LPTKQARIDQLLRDGYRAYTTSAGWLGYTEPQLRQLCREAVSAGWTHIKVKVGVDLEDDKKRLKVIREEIGDRTMMVDANQRWDVGTAIANMKELAQVTALHSLIHARWDHLSHMNVSWVLITV
jgi:L-fuconate dehydratase